MLNIAENLTKINNQNQKALAVFLTAGLPNPDKFVDLCLGVLNAGADILEIGIPFSDPIADGPVIQQSSKYALDLGINLKTVLQYTESIKQQSEKPIVLMGYANPILKYGLKNFIQDANNSGVDGLILPDIPLDEYKNFWVSESVPFDRILLTTPTSSNERIRNIDQLSSGFVYCVSVTGITGSKQKFDHDILQPIISTYDQIKKNKMLIGFGISSPVDVKKFRPMCDGVIVGSAVIKRLMNDHHPDFQETMKFVSELSKSCKIE